ncbi:MAG: DUF6531 domain-containing protein [Myxococcota bacterium]
MWSRLVFAALAASLLGVPYRSEAACATTGPSMAWGAFWLERTGANCDCVVKSRRFSCVKTGGFRTQDASPTVIATIAGDCSTACEDLAGYQTGINTMLAKYAPGAGNYECDSIFVDADQDGYGSCIDDKETNPRIGVLVNANETLCDGIDNDNDGVVDDGFTPACALDRKRLDPSSNVQGTDGDAVNLIDGTLIHREVDVTVDAPFEPLVFARNYDSQRGTDDAQLGQGWTHSYSVYLRSMPAPDSRMMVNLPDGHQEFFWCPGSGTDRSCVIDDHRPGGNLRMISSVWYYYPGDGTRWEFTGSLLGGNTWWKYHLDSAGNVLETANFDAVTKLLIDVTSTNSLIFLHFTYDGSSYLDKVRVSSTSVNGVLDFDVVANGGVNVLDRVTYAPTVNTFDANYFTAYTYNASSKKLESLQRKLDAGTTLTVASFAHDGSGRVTSLKGPSMDLSVAYTTATKSTVTYNIEAAGNPSTGFTHNGLWVTSRDSDQHVGGLGYATQLRDEHGRVTCEETDDSRVIKPIYGSGFLATRVDLYGKTGDCTSGGAVERKIWSSYGYNTSRQSRRIAWVREPSFYSPAADCSGGGLPAGCLETAYAYVSATDDRVQTITRKGYSRRIDGSIPQSTRVMRNLYFGLDGACTGDAYAGQVCRVETQDGSSGVFARTDYGYYAAGASNGGLLKQVQRYRSNADAGGPLKTTYAGHDLFGEPLSVTEASGVVTSKTQFGYQRLASLTETAALLASDGLTFLSPSSSYSYTMLREPSVVTLPKGNKLVTKYYTGATDFARPSAWSTADAASNLLEISRVLYDGLGNVKEDRVLDSISGSTPCADENCGTYDVRRERKFNVNRRVVESYLHASAPGTLDGTKFYTYTADQLTGVTDYLGVLASFTYDSQGRAASNAQDTAGVNASTSYTYDNHSRTATVTGPNGVTTYTEHDDFGALVLERSKTRGEMRYNYDAAGRQTQRRWTPYKSTSGPEDTCYSYDWTGRRSAIDSGCNGAGGANDWLFYYDGNTTPASACPAMTGPPTVTPLNGRLTRVKGLSSNSVSLERVLCYHPDGHILAVYQQDDGAAWSNTSARGSQVYYDVNGNVTTELVNASPASTSNAITIEYTYDATLQDRVASVRTKMNGVWTQATSSATYLALGGYKTLSYANGITETNTRDSDDRLTRRKTTFSASTYTDINLTYDKNGNITVYDDSTGLRHNKYYLAMDGLNRLRCTSRSAIGACTGAKPWETSYLESLDYDASGNRTNRRSGQYATADDETYALVTGPTDIINDVTYGGTNKLWSSDMKGDLTSVKDLGNSLAYTWDSLGRMSVSNDVSLSPTKHDYSPYGDRFRRTAPCNTRLSWYFYRPFGAGGVSPEISYQEEFGTCADGFPNEVHVPVYLEGRPVALVRAQRLANGTMQSPATYWLHSDQLGTPVLVTNASKVERWRWENDPFGRADPIEHTVFAYDQNPDWVVAEPNATTVSNTFTAGAPLNINNLRAHFSVFDVKAGATRTAKDYVQVKRGSDSAVIATLTGALGAFWGPWVATPGTSQTSMIISYTGDSKADGTAGIAVDKLEYTTSTNGRFVMYLRMPGQIWDNDAKASSNYQRWYRPQDGRYLSPDPIGLAGGEAGYFGYVGGQPSGIIDPQGLIWVRSCRERPGPTTQSEGTVTTIEYLDCDLNWVSGGYDNTDRPYTGARNAGVPTGGRGGGSKPPKKSPAPSPSTTPPPGETPTGFPHTFADCGGSSVVDCRSALNLATRSLAGADRNTCKAEVVNFLDYVCPNEAERYHNLSEADRNQESGEAVRLRQHHIDHRDDD